VVPGMTWCVVSHEAQSTSLNHLAITQCMEPFKRCRQEFAPQVFHLATVDALSASQQARRISQMWRAEVMDMDSGPLAGPPAGGTSVVEMYMGDQDVMHISRRNSMRGEARLESSQG